jgi:hypothetical protein
VIADEQGREIATVSLVAMLPAPLRKPPTERSVELAAQLLYKLPQEIDVLLDDA